MEIFLNNLLVLFSNLHSYSVYMCVCCIFIYFLHCHAIVVIVIYLMAIQPRMKGTTVVVSDCSAFCQASVTQGNNSLQQFSFN